EPPSSSVLAEIPALLVHASQFGLVRDEQLEQYERALGDGLEVVAVPGGHIVYWDAYEQTAEAVEKFLICHRDVSHT
ncbi:MAG TPA: alpha/beta hydrolase, partial [Gaiellaceae bacterium]|nr:alpha/beta hydrolase [Gaiellaceae bacterium]